ncbi:MAG: NAD(P)/FAD-dependent oxidoreductase [Rhodothermaceae bacterium]|nr:NAD(P)/FAD-dependent oxidoreductase [Rhodothermaceae bacterium]
MDSAVPHIRSVDGAPAADGFAPRPRIVVVGVGHGGMEAVKELDGTPADVLLVDRNNYHKFQPLLYQVATAGLQEGDITQSARHIFQKQKNVDFRLATVLGADLDARVLQVDQGPPIPYDYLILAAGASTAYFGVEGAQTYGFPLKNVADAVNLRSHVLLQFEKANRNAALIEEGALNFVVVGGGATGVETAGALIELFDRVLCRDFAGLDVDRARVILVERGDALMEAYKPDLQAYTKRQLEKRGVEVWLDTAVESVSAEAVQFEGGESLATQTLIWAAGVRANPLADELGLEQTRGSRLVVDDTLRVSGHPEVFAVGDLAGATDPTGQLYPQVAQVAIQQGIHAAKEIERAMRGIQPEAFQYKDLGQMATIGRNAAILEFPSGRGLKGLLAWLGWAVIHVVNLVGFRNRLSVLINWVYNYFTYDRGPRVIMSTWPETDEVQQPVLTTAPTASDGVGGSYDPRLATESEEA